MSTKCPPFADLIGHGQKITGYLPKDDGAKAAFKDADIIVIPAGIPRMYTRNYVTCTTTILTTGII